MLAHRLGFMKAARHPQVRCYQRRCQGEEQTQGLNLKLEISEQRLPATTFDEVITRESLREKGWRTVGMQSRSAGSDCAGKTLRRAASGRTKAEAMTQAGSLVGVATSLQMLKDFCPTKLTRSPKVPWQQHTLPVTNTGGEVIYSPLVNKLNLARGRIQRQRKTRLCLQKPLKHTLQTTRIGNAFSLLRTHSLDLDKIASFMQRASNARRHNTYSYNVPGRMYYLVELRKAPLSTPLDIFFRYGGGFLYASKWACLCVWAFILIRDSGFHLLAVTCILSHYYRCREDAAEWIRIETPQRCQK